MTNAELDIIFKSYIDKNIQCYALVSPSFSKTCTRRHPFPDWLAFTEQFLPIVKTWPEDHSGRIGLYLSFNLPLSSTVYLPLASEIKAIYPYDYIIKHHPEAIL